MPKTSNSIYDQKQMPKIEPTKKTYYFDEKLLQLRNVTNPHDVMELNEFEVVSIKLLIKRRTV